MGRKQKRGMADNTIADGPCLSFDQVRRAWFELNNHALSVMTYSDKEFKAFVAEQRPDDWHDPDAERFLKLDTLNDVARWCVLNELANHLRLKYRRALPIMRHADLNKRVAEAAV